MNSKKITKVVSSILLCTMTLYTAPVFGFTKDETVYTKYDSNGKVTGIYKKGTNDKVSACIIAGADPNNWLKYDGVEWRVLGLYDIHNDGTRLSAKMITHQTVDVQ